MVKNKMEIVSKLVSMSAIILHVMEAISQSTKFIKFGIWDGLRKTSNKTVLMLIYICKPFYTFNHCRFTFNNCRLCLVQVYNNNNVTLVANTIDLL